MDNLDETIAVPNVSGGTDPDGSKAKRDIQIFDRADGILLNAGERAKDYYYARQTVPIYNDLRRSHPLCEILDKYIYDELRRLYPDDSIRSYRKESCYNGNSKYRWYTCSLSGPENFTFDDDNWGIGAACLDITISKPVYGSLFCPLHDEQLSAGTTEGIYPMFNESKMNNPHVITFTPPVVALCAPAGMGAKHYPAAASSGQDWFDRIYGCDISAFMQVARGFNSGLVGEQVNPAIAMAAAVIIGRVGGRAKVDWTSIDLDNVDWEKGIRFSCGSEAFMKSYFPEDKEARTSA